MSRLWPCALLGLVLASGCSKHKPAPAGNAATSETNALADAAPPSPRGSAVPADTAAGAVVSDTTSLDATLAQLSSELRRFVVRTRTVPRNFEEFAAKSNLQAPPPPAGKKYAIQGQAVIVVKR